MSIINEEILSREVLNFFDVVKKTNSSHEDVINQLKLLLKWWTTHDKNFKQNVTILNYLLSEFIVDWGFALTENHKFLFYYPFFFGKDDTNPSFEYLQILNVIVFNLQKTIQKSYKNEKLNQLENEDIETIYKWQMELLLKWVDTKNNQIFKIFNEFLNIYQNNKTITEELREKMQNILGLPSKLGNLLQLNLPSEFLPQSFLENILGQLNQFVTQYNGKKQLFTLINHFLSKYHRLYPNRMFKFSLSQNYIY